MSLVGLDSNILAYNAAVRRHDDDGPKIEATRALFARMMRDHRLVAPVQALGELFIVILKTGRAREIAAQVVDAARVSLEEAVSAGTTLTLALDLAAAHRLQFWDSLILSACSEAGCAVVLSEDMGHGFAWRGLTVINPFADDAHQRLARLLA